MMLARETTRSEPIRILIVDDDAGMRGALRAVFSGDPRYSVQVAADGHDALALIETYRPHLVLVDLRTPGLDGADLCRAVKSSPVPRATRVLAMSGSGGDEPRERLLAAGADAFLAKPFTLSDLEAEVTRLT
jgi:CheY-like chemotaxis protein